MKKFSLLILMLAAVLLSACGGANVAPVDPNAMYKNFTQQERSYETFVVDSGTNGTAKIILEKGASVRVASSLPPLSARTRDPSTVSKLIDAGASVAKVAATGYFGTELIKALPSQQPPVVLEQPAPIIVPAAGP